MMVNARKAMSSGPAEPGNLTVPANPRQSNCFFIHAGSAIAGRTDAQGVRLGPFELLRLPGAVSPNGLPGLQ